MRRRLLVVSLAVLAATLVAFALPLAFSVRSLLVSRALDGLQGQTEQVAAFIDERARTCGEVRLLLSLTREGPPSLSVFDRQGNLVLTESGHRPTVGDEIPAALRGQAGRSVAGDRLAVAVPLSTSACGARLLLHAQSPDDALTASVRGWWLAIAAMGAAVLAFAAVGALLLGRRLAEPFEALARSARRLGEGDFSARAPRSGLEEADAIADALDVTATRLGRAVQRSRAFTADASHQLRTPLTALRLHLESIAARGDAPPEVDDALIQADRLEATVHELVALTELDEAEQSVDLGDLVTQRVESWRRLAGREDREVTLEVLPTPSIRIRPAAVGQALQVLLDNALEHGQGTITVRVAPSLPAEGAPTNGARIVVIDEGPGIPPGLAEQKSAGRDRGVAPTPRTGGRGLELARSLVEGEGGRLQLERFEGGTRATIVLPS